MITWRIVKWCGKTTNGIFAAKKKKKSIWGNSERSSKDRWQTSHQLKVHWKNLQAGVADVTLRWLFSFLQVVFFPCLISKLPFFHLFGYGRLSPSSIQSLLHDLLAERCSDAYSPCIFQTNNQLVLLQLLARDTVRVSVVRVLYFKEIGLQSSSKNGDESTQFIFMNFIKIRKK